MALIEEQNLCIYLSGGEAVPDDRYPYNSLGGARSAARMGWQPGFLFPAISAAQAIAGIVQYRCIYFRNDDANPFGLLDAKVCIVVPTISDGTEIDIGLAPEGLNGVAELLEDEVTTPADVIFSHPSSLDDGLALPTPLFEGDEVPVWVRRTVDPGATCSSEIDYGVLLFSGRSVE